MHDANEINSVLQREVEKQHRFESVCDWKATHPVQFCLHYKNAVSTFRLTGKHCCSSIGGGKKTVGSFDVGVLGVPDPLRDEIILCGLAFANLRHQTDFRALRASNCLSASARMSLQS